MNAKIISNWNKRVSNEDHIIFGGDFSFCAGATRRKELISSLNGYKTLIRGNHDDTRERMLRAGFDEVYDEIKMKYKGYHFLFSHYPYRPSYYEIMKAHILRRKLRFLDRRPAKQDNTWLIHGHVHNSWGKINRKLKMVNVSCDVWNFTPPSLDEIIKLIKRV